MYSYVIASWTLGFVVIVLFCLLTKLRRRLNLPAGPIGLPFVGYIPFLGKEPFKDFIKLSEKYGDVFGLKLGLTYTVVISDGDVIREALSKDECLGRPNGFLHLSDDYSNIIEMSGDTWIEHTKFAVRTLKILGMGKNKVEKIVHSQIGLVLQKFTCRCGEDLNIRECLAPAVDNVILSLITGKTIQEEDAMYKTVEEFQEIQHVMEATSLAHNNLFLRPFLLMSNPLLKKVMASAKQMEANTRKEIEEHEKNLNKSNPTDFIDHFLVKIRNSKNETEFNKGTLLGDCQALLLAGGHTSRSTLEWALLQMAEYPDIQEKVCQEIFEVLGKENPPTWDDKGRLPYTEAVLLESSRRRTLAPLSLPKRTLKATKISGYDIPKDTQIITNLWSVHMNPKNWKDPEKIIPERFLDENGALVPKSSKNVLPFSFGKRNCPAERLASVEVFLFFVSIIQKFKLLPPKSGLRLDSLYRTSYYPKYPVLRLEKR